MKINSIWSTLILQLFLVSAAHANLTPFAFWKTPAANPCTGGGYLYNSVCYYLSTTGDDCINTCVNAGVGGCLLDPTSNLGAYDNTGCQKVLQGLGQNPVTLDSGAYDYSCAIVGTTYRTTANFNPPSSCGTKQATAKRACGCGAGGLTQTGKATVDGYNYRLGATAASCNTVCASYGGCNQTGTTNAASSSAKCAEILAALDAAGGSGTGSGNGGCSLVNLMGMTMRIVQSGGSTCAGTDANAKRACACNNP